LYIPEFQRSIKGAKFDPVLVDELKAVFLGALLKVGYAFLWQEFFIPITFMYNEFGMTIGAMGMAYFNHHLNLFSGIK